MTSFFTTTLIPRRIGVDQFYPCDRPKEFLPEVHTAPTDYGHAQAEEALASGKDLLDGIDGHHAALPATPASGMRNAFTSCTASSPDLAPMWARYHARMTRSPLRETIVARVRDAIPDLRWLALFGSQARGDATPESDVDVGLFTAGVIPADRLRRIRGDLEVATGRDVHLVDLRAATTVLRSQIVATAEVLYSLGDRESEEFLDFVLSDYARPNEERSDILRDVRERGRIHGR